MKYTIGYDNPLSHLLNIKLVIDDISKPILLLKLPFWRPGRYEAANYAKNIIKVTAQDSSGIPLNIIKKGPSEWSINTDGNNRLEVTYQYFAFKMDAGNSFLDEDQLYINFINCLIYDEQRVNEPCEVTLDIPDSYDIACGIKANNSRLYAKNFYQLVDSPMIASPTLQHLQYESNGIAFNIWIQGENDLDAEKLVSQFSKFSALQINTMGSFPESDYHFILHILPYKFYHGVEHGNSTVITLGPAEEVIKPEMYSDLLGVSSHELFHAWNILKIRPKELTPYSFNEIPIFPTGFVAEGFTTYYGDLFLVRSKVYDKSWYFNELNKLFKRHFLNFGRLVNSVVDSSIDLWLDGYQLSAPNKKSSIYVEGAVSSLLLDLTIRKTTQNKKSLDDVLRLLWVRFGQKSVGYSLEDIEESVNETCGTSIHDFFERFIYGIEDKEEYLSKMLNYVGCEFNVSPNKNLIERYFGIKTGSTAATNHMIILITPNSVGEKHFSIRDEIIKVNGVNFSDFDTEVHCDEYHFEVKRNYKTEGIKLSSTNDMLLNEYSISQIENANDAQIDAFKSWLGL